MECGIGMHRKINWKQTKNIKALEIGILVTAGIFCCWLGAECGNPWPWYQMAQVVSADARESGSPEELDDSYMRAGAKKRDTQDSGDISAADRGPKQTPVRLNMAFVFPEGAEDPSQSYAGQVFYKLNQKDIQWISQIYGNSQVSPADMAARLGSKKDTGNQTSWTNVNVTFYNGDGSPISGYSNAKEILSMASVYAYYRGIENQEEFDAYAENLWNASHSYSISIGDLYYCDGKCLLEDDEEEREADDLPEEISLEILAAEAAAEAALPEAVSEAPDEAESEEEETTPLGWVPEGPGAVTKPAAKKQEASDSGESLIATEKTEERTAETTAAAETLPETAAAAPENTGEESAGTTAETTAEAAAEATDPTETTPWGWVSGGPGDTTIKTASPADASPAMGGTSPAESSPIETAPSETAATEAAAESFSADNASRAESSTSDSGRKSSDGSGKQEAVCPGHIDLNIKAVISGLGGTNNLYAIDSAGNSEEGFSGNWYGWAGNRRSCVYALDRQDWYEKYGLTISTSMYVRNPLTASEVQYYMNLLPEGTSDARRLLIQQALQSIGGIPYYWGGKPYGPGYEGNGFGTIVTPDYRGRTLRGLDCSGWISWVYWTALGRELPYQSTGGLCSLGRGISREALRPGDIILRTGKNAHVYMFLAWAGNGSMYLIHETGGITNNVTVGIYNVDWPYNRDLIGD